MSWAYLHETYSSFAIEKELPAHTKAEAFVALLKQASQASLLDEAYLVALQNLHHQSARPSRRVQVPTKLAAWAFANEAPKQIDPLVCAAVVSFAFVFIHPFVGCLQNKGKVSANQRKKFAGTVHTTVFDAIEHEWQSLFAVIE